ncbi:hypothetical protein B0T10DRAFT_404088 [Thelonectria olida]|uniref:Uncharacterized protein n=1 Tax=Thelonectria olida TaxID=1576542 RepID=A0A9P9ASV9_9HYPO|nr:hypothetical protein B0T10DRAFT_404088 [Thelonectria olida]
MDSAQHDAVKPEPDFATLPSTPHTDQKLLCYRTREIRPKPTGYQSKEQTRTDPIARELPTRAARQNASANHAKPVIQPKAGELYFAYRKQSQCWLAALLLPYQELDDVGISGTVDSLGLSRNVPDCHSYNVNTRALEWREGYEDGGPSSYKRKFPIAYFTGPTFPDSGATDWVAAEDLRVLDESCLIKPSPVPHCRVVRTFLERRAVSGALKARMGNFLFLSGML